MHNILCTNGLIENFQSVHNKVPICVCYSSLHTIIKGLFLKKKCVDAWNSVAL